MSGDRHKGEPRCLHPQSQRAVTTKPGGGPLKEQCLYCRAVRFRKLVKRTAPSGYAAPELRWGPWVSAGEQVKQALLAKAQDNMVTDVTPVVNVQLSEPVKYLALSLKLEDK